MLHDEANLIGMTRHNSVYTIAGISNWFQSD